MRILVTGATGFIGRRLVERLAASHEVVSVSRTRADGLPEGVHAVSCDMRNSNWVEHLPSEVDVVAHLAQSRHHRSFPEKADDVFSINVRATFDLLEWSRASGVRRFLYASTANVYSESEGVLDELSACEPKSLYGSSKLCGERLLLPYAEHFEVAALRLFTVFGKGQEGRLFSDMIKRIRAGEEISLAKGIGIRMSPIEVGVLVEAMERMLQVPRWGSTCYNLCGAEEISLRAVVDHLGRALDLEPKIVETEGRVLSLRGSAKRWEAEFGKVEGLPFEEAVSKLV